MPGADEFTFFAVPDGAAMPLSVVPRLESWDAKGTRSQIELGQYLDHVAGLITPQLEAIDGPAGIWLSVGLPKERPLTSGGGDLDNFLYPIVRRLRPQRFETAWAHKGRGASTIGVGPARPTLPPSGGWHSCTVVTTRSAQTPAFKEEVAASVPSLPASTVPIEMQIAYRLSDRRNWAALWKPTIDALGGVLGVPNPARPFMPHDDRIVRLGFHRMADESLGWEIAIAICWRPA